MKKYFRLFAVCLVVSLVLSVFTFIGCKEEEAEESTETTVVEEETSEEETVEEETATEETIDLSNLGPIQFFDGHPSWEDGWNAVIAGFKEKTGIDVETTFFADMDTLLTATKTSIITDEGPDVFTWWSNFKIIDLAREGLLYDLTSLYDSIPGKYSPGILDAMSYEDKIYGAPFSSSSWVMFYSKTVFEKYNLQIPETWDEFISICDTLKADGVTPIAFTIGGGWTSFFWFQQIMASNWPDAYYDVCQGRKSWTCDEVEQTFLIWKDMIEKGYFTDPGTDLGNEVPSMLAKGEVGMTYCGDWYSAYLDAVELIGETDYSIFIIPSYVEDRPKTVIYETGPMVISENAPNKEAAVLFVEYFLSDEGQELWCETLDFISPNSDVSLEISPLKQKIAAEVFADKDAELVGRFWEATLETMTMSAGAAFEKFVLDPGSYESVMAEIDALSTAAWAEYESE